jgi:hypothetical protein
MGEPLVTDSEAVALRWVANHLHVLSCERCGGRWITGRSQRIIFHECERPEQTWSVFKGAEERNEEERRRWALAALGALE